MTVEFAVPASGATLHIALDHDFALDEPALLPLPGETSRGVHILEQHWSATRDSLALEVSGHAGSTYDLPLWNPAEIASVSGATLAAASAGGSDAQVLRVSFAQGDPERRSVILSFKPRK